MVAVSTPAISSFNCFNRAISPCKSFLTAALAFEAAFVLAVIATPKLLFRFACSFKPRLPSLSLGISAAAALGSLSPKSVALLATALNPF